MSLNIFASLLAIFFCSLFSSTTSFNITQILNKFGDFSTFNTQLSKTGVADEINSRKSITILAVNNAGMSDVIVKHKKVMKDLMMMHVVLDYLDIPKLYHLNGKSTILTTLFQASGKAKGQQGFMNLTVANGYVTFSSAAGGKTATKLVKSVMSHPYSVAVLEIYTMIIPPNHDVSPLSPPTLSPGNWIPAMPPSKNGPSPSEVSPRMSPSGTPGPSPRGRIPGVTPPGTPGPSPRGRSPRMSPSGTPGPSPRGRIPGVTPPGTPGPSPRSQSPNMPPTQAPRLSPWSPKLSPMGAPVPSPRGQIPRVSPAGAPGQSPGSWSPRMSPERAPGPSSESWSPKMSPERAPGPSSESWSPNMSPERAPGPSSESWSPRMSPSETPKPSFISLSPTIMSPSETPEPSFIRLSPMSPSNEPSMTLSSPSPNSPSPSSSPTSNEPPFPRFPPNPFPAAGRSESVRNTSPSVAYMIAVAFMVLSSTWPLASII